ncbi:hypothetical protein NDU88_006015 [Pleurodeles waltl]|uniref:Uncharacterized protein n=1 Tax=Pleurodeles waltl TaxID=8319 RepID=A0AAV7TVL2_PLEWA|nr:hypothetical protein NDU88_006015 [Pleurodeles waltl]
MHTATVSLPPQGRFSSPRGPTHVARGGTVSTPPSQDLTRALAGQPPSAIPRAQLPSPKGLYPSCRRVLVCRAWALPGHLACNGVLRSHLPGVTGLSWPRHVTTGKPARIPPEDKVAGTSSQRVPPAAPLSQWAVTSSCIWAAAPNIAGPEPSGPGRTSSLPHRLLSQRNPPQLLVRPAVGQLPPPPSGVAAPSSFKGLQPLTSPTPLLLQSPPAPHHEADRSPGRGLPLHIPCRPGGLSLAGRSPPRDSQQLYRAGGQGVPPRFSFTHGLRGFLTELPKLTSDRPCWLAPPPAARVFLFLF